MSAKVTHLPPVKQNFRWDSDIVYRNGIAHKIDNSNQDLSEEFLNPEERQFRFHWNVSGAIPCEIKNFNTIQLSFNYNEITCKKCRKLLSTYKIFPTFEGEAIEVCRDSVIEKDYKKGLVVLEQNCIEGSKYIPFLFELILIMSRWLTKDETSFKDIMKDDRSVFLSVLKARTKQRADSLEQLVYPRQKSVEPISDSTEGSKYWNKLLGLGRSKNV